MEDAADASRSLRARTALVLGPALCAALWLLPLDLAPEAQRLSGVMALVVCFWIGEPIPVAATALLGPALALLAGAVPGNDARQAFGKFGDPILMLFIGGFFIAHAMTVHGLDRRIALRVLSLSGLRASPGRMAAGLGLCTCLLSMWMSNTAVTAIMIPIAAGMLRASAAPPRTETACYLMLSFSATVGGLGTPVGTAPNLIGLAQIAELGGVRIGFLQWMLLSAPFLVLMMLALLFVLARGLPGGPIGRPERAVAWSRGEKTTALAFALAVGLWMASGLAQVWKGGAAARFFETRLPEGAIALLASSVLFLLPGGPRRPALTWREAARIDWGTLLLLGGGLCLGDLMVRTGLAEALGTGLARHLPEGSLWTLVTASAGMAIVLSEVCSNTATATMLVPVVIGVAKAASLPVLPPALAATLGCSFGFMLPVSTPPNALVYGTGKVPAAYMARKGFVFDGIGFVLIPLGLRVICPLMGLGG